MTQQRVQKEKQASKREAQPAPEVTVGEQADLSTTDALLDEIDSVLEENAQEFVNAYVQKGGE